MPGDVVILATDGLFDNIMLDDIVHMVEDWEERWYGAKSEHIDKTESDSAAQQLAKDLVMRAREYSLDTNRDSPFALLAKENDIMWGGGMPDDCTVIALRVTADGQGSVR